MSYNYGRCECCGVVAGLVGPRDVHSVGEIRIALVCFQCWHGLNELIACAYRDLVPPVEVVWEMPF